MLTWAKIFQEEEKKKYFQDLLFFLKEEKKADHSLLPKTPFQAFYLTPFDQVRVIILGQDPYPNKNHAHGLAFSSLDKKIPASLKTIYKELQISPTHANLTSWAQQGVLLLNRILTVREGEALSHKNKGWEIFTENILKKLNDEKEFLIFCLWGQKAQEVASFLHPRHLILKAAHPSPLARGAFLGCDHFKLINNQLNPPINWQVI